MLVLSRKKKQSVVVTFPGGYEMTVVIVEVRGGGETVRIGFDAPPEIKINRSEIQARIDADSAAPLPLLEGSVQ